MDPEDTEAWSKALDDIKEWFEDHEAGSIVANLLPPASGQAIADVEATLGASLPASLRWLYSVHGGQRDREANPLFEDLVFCDPSYALGLRSGMLIAYFTPGPNFVDPKTPLRDNEKTQRWYPLANTSHAFLAVNLDSGRVVLAQKDSPAIHVVADSVGDFLAAYASALWDDEYRLDGDHVTKRDSFRY